MKINWDKLKNFIITGLGILVALLILFHGCGDTVKPTPVNNKIITDLKLDTEAKNEAKKSDSVRIVYRTKFKYIITNPEKLPCDTFVKVVIAYCDTVIQKDSTEIEALKKVIKQDSVLIVDYQEQGNKDSVLITKLERKVKLNRTIAKLAFVTGLGLGGFVGVKLR